ncbi:MAG: hypothetical protein ACHQ53_02930 [Polyangiales bacterium]
MKEQKIGRKTSPGFADPNEPVRLGEGAPQPVMRPVPAAEPPPPAAPPAVAVPPAPAVPSPSARPRGRGKPIVEIEVVRERSRAPRPEPTPGCYEIWTQNNVYVVDSRMRCLQVREVGSGESKADHPFVGARLVGGQTQEVAMEMSHPLPRPGSHAVFEMRKGNRRQFTRTSQVERVVLRLRIVTIADGNEVPTWDDLVADDD